MKPFTKGLGRLCWMELGPALKPDTRLLTTKERKHGYRSLIPRLGYTSERQVCRTIHKLRYIRKSECVVSRTPRKAHHTKYACGSSELPVCEGPVHRSHSSFLEMRDAEMLPIRPIQWQGTVDPYAPVQTGMNGPCYACRQNDHRRFSYKKKREQTIGKRIPLPFAVRIHALYVEISS